ncbi:fungal hydrophobin-domain-containing protein [Trametes maxima]|nr:fungal hydrophobin-domain-containing protein [Trametes maxima]
MFARVAVASVLALPLLAAAQSCNTGSLRCCQSVQSSDSASVAGLLGALGVVLNGVTAQVGLDCSPISVIGAGQSSCSAKPVCCENNSFGSAVAIGCAPVEL